MYLPRSADMAELIRLAGPPIQNPVTDISTELTITSLGDSAMNKIQ